MIPGRFSGKRAVVTGASSGIGRATALRLAREGARVALIARGREGLDAVAAEIGPDAGALVLPADCTDEASIAAAIDRGRGGVRRAGYRRFQRRHRAARAGRPRRPAGAGGLAAPAAQQPRRPVPHLQARHPPPARRRGRGRRLRRLQLRLPRHGDERASLQRQQGRRLRHDAGDGYRLRAGRHPRQHGRPRLHRHADERARHAATRTNFEVLERPDSRSAAPALPKSAPRRSSGWPRTRRRTASARRSSSTVGRRRYEVRAASSHHAALRDEVR